MSTCRRTIQAQTWKIIFLVVCNNANKQVIQRFCVHLFSLTNFFEKIDNDTFAFSNTQPSIFAGLTLDQDCKFPTRIVFSDFLGCKVYSFLNNEHYKQMMPAHLQSHPSVCGFYTIYAAFHLFKFGQKENTGVHDVNALSFISNFM